jgi:type I restriction enzyme S subunit
MSKFLSEKLGVAAEIIPGFAFKSEEFGKTGTIAVKIKDINPPIINAAEADRVNVSNYSRERLKKYEIHEGDFVVAMTGATVGKIGKHVSKEVLYTNQRVAKIVPRSGFYKEFVYYAIQGGDFLKFILNRLDSSSAQGNISGTSIGEYPIPCPDFQTQRGVAAVLSALDSKIELNNRINAELEGMAKLLYDYWFVQFDFPMTAAQAAALGKPHLTGHPYRASGGKMIYNETLKRDIPEGWAVKPLFDAMAVQYGFPFSTKKFTTEITDVPVIRIRDILENSISLYTTEQVDEKYRLEPLDLVIGMDGNFHMNFWDKDGSYLNQRSVRIRPRADSSISSFQAYFELSPYIKAREKNVSRTTVGHLSDKDLKRLHLLQTKGSKEFDPRKTFDSLLSKIIHSRAENQELTQLRDWLLPMLMNGQVTVGTSEG